ncbi:hypothetical protein [Paenibacillus sp. R14(2021)]|uniref:hypothetical protein n=1 Tax=Paenibacillus sp. R14(2021) TaxID=2859228 RepID=UPI001C611BA2|nr:hypothetical protein [Paenibacillus sp. R14(2021)]
MKIAHRKLNSGTWLPVGTRMHDSLPAPAAVGTDSETTDRRNFKFALFNGALLVMPFWILVIWLLIR